jgi:valyl-tRNA synthetase
MEQLAPRYDPKAVEGPLYRKWLEANAFHADPKSGKPAFCIVIPPPNVTGSLHMGHALNNTLQDILTRWKRMQGFNACWVPGTDHAGIATQVMVERDLKKEGLTRHDLGREKFLERAWAWKEKYGNRIVEQLKLMGCSCDWERLRFTMDEGLSHAVLEHFVRLHSEGLIYRGERIVNWCPRCLTALSDLEVVHRERKGHLWHIRYPLKGGGEVVVATTRPETMLGDTAVAVHPADKRHTAIVGKTVILPLMEREIPVVADDMVAMDFGTGAVKITPAHDPADFDLGARHKLPVINIMEKDAKLNANAGAYAGLDRQAGRDKVVADLEARGLLVKIDDHVSAVTHCQRCDSVLEPLVSMQWYVKATALAPAAIKAVELGEKTPDAPGAVRLIPDNAPAVFYEWMRNIKDWCISRQLWWGHRIPAWYCTKCPEITVARSAPAKCPKCGGSVEQDPDTLDTWFSSALWPFSTLGWPDQPEMDKLGYKKFYPTTVLVTASDILFFWVARMMMAGLHLAGNIPFKTVVLNSLVTDPEGKKMSKTKGNVVDPLDLFNQFGTDAVRFTLTEQETLKQSFRMSDDRVEHSRNFMNKIWNAARFALGEMGEYVPTATPPANRSLADRWIMGRLDSQVEGATSALENYRFSEYAGGLEDFFWNTFCDEYLELAKAELKDPARREGAQWTLCRCLDTLMRLMHPVVPFITEEIWARLPRAKDAGLVMLADWPRPIGDKADREAAAIMDSGIAVIGAIRSLKHEQGLAYLDPSEIFVHPMDGGAEDRLNQVLKLGYIPHLTHANITVMKNGEAPKPNSSTVVPGFSVYMAISAADTEAEKARLSKELAELESVLAKTRATLANENYVKRAPANVVEETRAKEADFAGRIARIKEKLGQLA